MFDDVILEWNGVKYPVPADRQMKLIFIVEDGLKTSEGNAMVTLSNPEPNIPLLSDVYSKALRFAGAEVTALEIYRTIQSGLVDGSPKAIALIQSAIMGLMTILLPEIAEEKIVSEDDEKKP